MMGVTHIAIGVSFGVFVARSTDLAPNPVEWICLIVGSLAPDIDSGNSLIARPGSLLDRFLPRFLTVILDFIGTTVSRLFLLVFGHRNLIHWPLLAYVFILGGHMAELSPLIWFGWGYLLHIVGDLFTKGGAPIFAPFYRKNVSWMPLKTGSWPERVLAASLWLYIGYAGFFLLPLETQHWLGRYGRLAMHGVDDDLRRGRYSSR